MAVFVQYPLRLPPDVKAFIEAEAKENASSQNSEIVRAIRGSMKARDAIASVAMAREVGEGKRRNPLDENDLSALRGEK